MTNAQISDSLKKLVNERLSQLCVFLTEERKQGLELMTIPEQVRLMEDLANATRSNATKFLVTAITRARFNRDEESQLRDRQLRCN